MPASEQEWQEFRDRTRRAVRHGAALLDRRQKDWRPRIDTYHLEMHDCDACVLGQLFGEFGNGLDILRIQEPKDEAYGFAVSHDDEEYFGFSAWMELGRCWREEIRRREADHG